MTRYRKVWVNLRGRGCRRLRLVVRLAAALAFASILVGQACSAMAQVVTREYAIKAGVIGVLIKCVNWPPDAAPAPGKPLTIGVLGSDPFFENGVNQLDRIAAEARLKGDAIAVMRFRTAAEYRPCHILFVSRSAADSATAGDPMKIAEQLTAGATVLVVGESTGLAEQGAVANLVYDRATNHIRLEINPDAAARAGLKLAPDLLRLKLVQIVRDPRR